MCLYTRVLLFNTTHPLCIKKSGSGRIQYLKTVQITHIVAVYYTYMRFSCFKNKTSPNTIRIIVYGKRKQS